MAALTATYYFNAYDSGSEEWETTPANMVDGDTGTYAQETNNGVVQLLTGNTCTGTDLGHIVNVEVWIYAKAGGALNWLKVRPVFDAGDGDSSTVGASTSAEWTGKSIFTGTNAPEVWAWDNVADLQCDIESYLVIAGSIQVNKVEIRVTYHEVETASYYYDSYDSTYTDATDPGNAIDNSLSTYAVTQSGSGDLLLDTNTATGNDATTTITRVEVRYYATQPGPSLGQVQPTWGSYPGDVGDVHSIGGVVLSEEWSDYIDITGDTDHPSPWTWADVAEIGFWFYSSSVINIYKAEVRVSYLNTATVTYYYDDYESGNTTWTTTPENACDGSLSTFAQDILTANGSQYETLRFDSNTCPGDELGDIINVKVRDYAELTDTEATSALTRQVFFTTSGGSTNFTTGEYTAMSEGWTDWYDYSNDFIQNTDGDFASFGTGHYLGILHYVEAGEGGTAKIAKSEFMITYIVFDTYKATEISMALSLESPSTQFSSTIYPSTISLTLSAGNPSINIYINPGTFPLGLAAPVPYISTTGDVAERVLSLSIETPEIFITKIVDTVNGTLSIEAVTVVYSSSTKPSEQTTALSLETPIIHLGNGAVPVSQDLILSVVDPSILFDYELAVVSVSASLSSPAPTIVIYNSPDTLSINLSILTPTLIFGKTALPSVLELALSEESVNINVEEDASSSSLSLSLLEVTLHVDWTYSAESQNLISEIRNQTLLGAWNKLSKDSDTWTKEETSDDTWTKRTTSADTWTKDSKSSDTWTKRTTSADSWTKT